MLKFADFYAFASIPEQDMEAWDWAKVIIICVILELKAMKNMNISHLIF